MTWLRTLLNGISKVLNRRRWWLLILIISFPISNLERIYTPEFYYYGRFPIGIWFYIRNIPIALIMSALVVTGVSYFFRLWQKPHQIDQTQKDILNEVITNEFLPLQTEKIDSIVPYLNLTNYILESISYTPPLSVFIDGEWGTGKTTFLNFFERNISKHLPESKSWIIKKFNPWSLHRYGSPIDSFIEIFKGRTEYPLFKKIKKFISQGPSYLKSIQLLFDLEEPSLNEVVSQINDQLRTDQQKLLVIVDDFDRCSKDQIEELVRLIAIFTNSKCNTYNIAFIIAGSAKLVEKQLTAFLGLSDTTGYLDKLFRTFELPYSKDIVAKFLIDKIKNSGVPLTINMESTFLESVIKVLNKIPAIDRRKCLEIKNLFKDFLLKSNFTDLTDEQQLFCSSYILKLLLIRTKCPTIFQDIIGNSLKFVEECFGKKDYPDAGGIEEWQKLFENLSQRMQELDYKIKILIVRETCTVCNQLIPSLPLEQTDKAYKAFEIIRGIISSI